MTLLFSFCTNFAGLTGRPADYRLLAYVQLFVADFFEFTFTEGDPENPGKWIFEDRLVAFVAFRRGDEEIPFVKMLDLGPTDGLVELIDGWTRFDQPTDKQNEISQQLKRRLWAPIAEMLEDRKVVLISADAVVAKLPFAALPGKTPDTYLIEEYAISYVPVPSLLTEIDQEKPESGSSNELLLIGDVSYDRRPAADRETDSRIFRPAHAKPDARARTERAQRKAQGI